MAEEVMSGDQVIREALNLKPGQSLTLTIVATSGRGVCAAIANKLSRENQDFRRTFTVTASNDELTIHCQKRTKRRIL